jgi:hypothetical protein
MALRRPTTVAKQQVDAPSGQERIRTIMTHSHPGDTVFGPAPPPLDATIPTWAKFTAQLYFGAEPSSGLYTFARATAQEDGLVDREPYNESVFLTAVGDAYAELVINSLGPVEVTGWRFAGVQPQCPVYRRKFNLRTIKHFNPERPCKSPWCLEHARLKVRAQEMNAAARFAIEGEMYYGTFEIPDEEAQKRLTTFLTGRVTSVGKGSVGYLKVPRTDVAHLFSTRALTSRKKTISIPWIPLSPYATMQTLHAVEHLPSAGVRHYWRGKWAPSTTRTTGQSEIVDFGPVRQDMFEDADAHVRASLRDRGIVLRDLTVEQRRDLYAMPLKAEIDRLRAAGKVTPDTSDDDT